MKNRCSCRKKFFYANVAVVFLLFIVCLIPKNSFPANVSETKFSEAKVSETYDKKMSSDIGNSKKSIFSGNGSIEIFSGIIDAKEYNIPEAYGGGSIPYDEVLNEIYAPVIENNKEKLEHIMEYGDEFCSVYVSTSGSLTVHEEILNKLKTISDTLCEGIETEHEKVRAIAYWVAENIYYNHVAAETEVNSDTISLETTLKIMATTCAGYSNLFSALCNMQGMYCVNMRGGTCEVMDSPEYIMDMPINHEWTAVIADGEWMYIDTTWLSNNSYTAEEGYVKADDFDDMYFDMSFEFMSYEHRIDLVDYRDFKSSVNALK